MNRGLTRRPYTTWHVVDGEERSGPPSNVRGDLTDVSGDLSDVSGDLTGVYGNLSGLRGDLSGVYGNLSGLRGDLSGVRGDLGTCDITAGDRARGVDVSELIADDRMAKA